MHISKDRLYVRLANGAARLVARPISFAGAVSCVLLWALFGPVSHFSDTWQLIINTGTTVITFLMVFLIQNFQNRQAEETKHLLEEILKQLKDKP
jgi:low affinity Fe/Cu permease